MSNFAFSSSLDRNRLHSHCPAWQIHSFAVFRYSDCCHSLCVYLPTKRSYLAFWWPFRALKHTLYLGRTLRLVPRSIKENHGVCRAQTQGEILLLTCTPGPPSPAKKSRHILRLNCVSSTRPQRLAPLRARSRDGMSFTTRI